MTMADTFLYNENRFYKKITVDECIIGSSDGMKENTARVEKRRKLAHKGFQKVVRSRKRLGRVYT